MGGGGGGYTVSKSSGEGAVRTPAERFFYSLKPPISALSTIPEQDALAPKKNV